MALVLAILEVQIEGANGWAAKLPTWRPHSNKWYAKLYKKLLNQKEMTGYHLSINFFIILIFHLPFLFGVNWSIEKELDILVIFFLFIVVWDYLWFVVNPKFTVKNFRGEHIFWHKKWLLKLPRNYWSSTLISLLLAIMINIYYNQKYLNQWLIMFLIFFALTILTKWFIKIFKPEWE